MTFPRSCKYQPVPRQHPAKIEPACQYPGCLLKTPGTRDSISCRIKFYHPVSFLILNPNFYLHNFWFSTLNFHNNSVHCPHGLWCYAFSPSASQTTSVSTRCFRTFCVCHCSSPQPFWHQGLVLWKTIFHPPGMRGCFQDNSSTLHYCTLYFYYYINPTSDHRHWILDVGDPCVIALATK